MEGIKFFLNKFKNLTPPHYFIKKELTLSIKKILNINIKKEHISISSDIIYVKTSPIIKSEIFIKKNLILQDLSKRISKYNKNITDIR